MAEKIDIKKVVDYWKKGAERSFETAEFLFKGKRYPDCLFFCHLTLEKVLKGIVVKLTKTHAPYSHKLVDLAEVAKIELTEQQKKDLTEITKFNIATRYNDYKLKFHKKCDREYAKKYYVVSKNLYLWLKRKI